MDAIDRLLSLIAPASATPGAATGTGESPNFDPAWLRQFQPAATTTTTSPLPLPTTVEPQVLLAELADAAGISPERQTTSAEVVTQESLRFISQALASVLQPRSASSANSASISLAHLPASESAAPETSLRPSLSTSPVFTPQQTLETTSPQVAPRQLVDVLSSRRHRPTGAVSETAFAIRSAFPAAAVTPVAAAVAPSPSEPLAIERSSPTIPDNLRQLLSLVRQPTAQIPPRGSDLHPQSLAQQAVPVEGAPATVAAALAVAQSSVAEGTAIAATAVAPPASASLSPSLTATRLQHVPFASRPAPQDRSSTGAVASPSTSFAPSVAASGSPDAREVVQEPSPARIQQVADLVAPQSHTAQHASPQAAAAAPPPANHAVAIPAQPRVQTRLANIAPVATTAPTLALPEPTSVSSPPLAAGFVTTPVAPHVTEYNTAGPAPSVAQPAIPSKRPLPKTPPIEPASPVVAAPAVPALPPQPAQPQQVAPLALPTAPSPAPRPAPVSRNHNTQASPAPITPSPVVVADPSVSVANPPSVVTKQPVVAPTYDPLATTSTPEIRSQETAPLPVTTPPQPSKPITIAQTPTVPSPPEDSSERDEPHSNDGSSSVTIGATPPLLTVAPVAPSQPQEAANIQPLATQRTEASIARPSPPASPIEVASPREVTVTEVPPLDASTKSAEVTTVAVVHEASSTVQPRVEPVVDDRSGLRAQHLTQRLVDAVANAQRPDNGFSIQLAPAELGRIHVELRRKGGKLEFRVGVATQAAEQLLVETFPQLRESLEQQGVVLEQAEVYRFEGEPSTNLGNSQSRQQSASQERGTPLPEEWLLDEPPELPTAPAANSTNANGLNIRV